MIIVFGSINMDLLFEPDHVPDGGETVLLDGYCQLPGGKGANQAVSAARMGSQSQMAGCVGEDGFGAQLISHLEAQGIDTSLTTKGIKPTGTAIITLEPSGENRIMVAAGANKEVKAEQVPLEQLSSGNTVLMQMETDPEQINKLAQRASSQGARVILNLAPAIPPAGDTLAHVDYLILNEIETSQIAKYLGYESNNYKEAAHSLAREFNLTTVVTLGGKGAAAITATGSEFHAAAIPVSPIVDTTGAGDAFCGAFAAALDQGNDLATALALGAATGSLACLKKGAMTSYPARNEVLKALEKNSNKPPPRPSNNDFNI